MPQLVAERKAITVQQSVPDRVRVCRIDGDWLRVRVQFSDVSKVWDD